MESESPLEERIVQVLRQLGITRAHFGVSMVPDWRGLATHHTDLVASLTVVCPSALDPNDLSAVASRLMVFTGDRGPHPERLRRSLAGFRDAALITLSDYLAETWADVIADRTQEVAGRMLEFLQRMDQQDGPKALALPESDGEVAGISYRVRGAGPPLVLFPLALAPSQWDPLLPTLGAHYCTISLGGAALGMVAYLELRGRLGYLDAVRRLIDAVRVRPGEVIAEIGCGSGVLIRWLARQTGGANRILGVDINRYLLREAAALARKDGLTEAPQFAGGRRRGVALARQQCGRGIRVYRPGGGQRR
jgi:2-polyprenyl-3-methyl-5-hydroxy-6-metoxy-1,4-benzoquinol methylase